MVISNDPVKVVCCPPAGSPAGSGSLKYQQCAHFRLKDFLAKDS